jgi:SSS family solute:Na+ symporter
LVKKYCPTGLLGLALTALLASFMSGMAGNVTAFNTIWTYDLYQAYLAPNKSDQHYFRMGQGITVVGVLLSIACAYFAKRYDNAMDVIQLVFSFVNAPVFATFVLAMFWKRATGTGAFLGLLGGITTSTLVHGLTIAEGKGGWMGTALYTFPSSMAQNFWLAICAFIVCFVLTLVISLATKRTKTDEELKGLVYSLTPKLKDEDQNWLLRPAVFGTILLVVCVILNVIFW